MDVIIQRLHFGRRCALLAVGIVLMSSIGCGDNPDTTGPGETGIGAAGAPAPNAPATEEDAYKLQQEQEAELARQERSSQ